MSTTGRSTPTVRKPDDRRVSRTRRQIDKAFLALLQHKGYEAVGVSDIVREADVGRATFYEHYASKDELLRSQLRDVVAATLVARPGETGPLDALRLFSHVRDVPQLYRLVAGRSAVERSLRILQEVMLERVGAVLHEHLRAGATLRAPLVPAVTARVIVANLAALLAWWTESGLAATPDEVQAMLQACVGPLFGDPGVSA